MPQPPSGRIFRVGYRVRLSDADATGRLRLDAVARYLQDAAIDDVSETGWGAPEHLWVLRSVRIDVLAPFLADELRRHRDVGQQPLVARGRAALVALRRRRRDDRGRQHVDPPRARRASGSHRRGLRRLRDGHAGARRVDEAHARGAGGRHAGRVAAPLDRRGSHGPRQQRRVLGRGRGAASASTTPTSACRTGLGSNTDIRSTSGRTSSSSRTRATAATSLRSSSDDVVKAVVSVEPLSS